MRRLSALLLAVVLIMTLCSCGETITVPDDDYEIQETEPNDADPENHIIDHSYTSSENSLVDLPFNNGTDESLAEELTEEAEGCSVSVLVYPQKGEISDGIYECITGESTFQYVVWQYDENWQGKFVSIEQNIMDFTYALPFLESDGTQIRMDMEFKEYAISDLDGDGTDELIYYVYPGGEGYFLIFHDFGETVCAYGLRYRSVGKITYDGCMEGVDGASRSNMWKFTSFSTSGYETEEISKFDSDKDEYIVLGEPVSQEEAVAFFRQNYYDKEEIKWIKLRTIGLYEANYD